MNISIIEGSNYFKGLLLLIRKDRKVDESEVALMRRIGKTLGFEQEFCDQAIHDILENEYIEDIIPEFSTKELAEKFLIDGLSIALSDDVLHPSEKEWLHSIAVRYGLDGEWFQAASDRVRAKQKSEAMEVDDITVQYS